MSKIINLAYPNKSDLKYKISKFPDGQQQVIISQDSLTDKMKLISSNYPKEIIESFIIKSRLNNFQDLELIICATKSLRNLGAKEIHLYTPYFLGSRSDRQFEEGSNNYLKDVICPIINSLNFESVTVLDPHSDVLEACLNNFKKESNLKILNHFLLFEYSNRELSNKADKDGNIEMFGNNFILISPDAGASKKIYKLAEQIGYKGDIITCSKDRDENGKLTKCVVPIKAKNSFIKKDYIIIDDICDGGATFINIAKELKERLVAHKGKIYLIVTHGIFSKGYKQLAAFFDGIYCTNSYSEFRAFEDSDVKYQKSIHHLNIF